MAESFENGELMNCFGTMDDIAVDEGLEFVPQDSTRL
jgi:hypothetical protein